MNEGKKEYFIWCQWKVLKGTMKSSNTQTNALRGHDYHEDENKTPMICSPLFITNISTLEKDLSSAVVTLERTYDIHTYDLGNASSVP